MKGDQHALQNLWIKEKRRGGGEIIVNRKRKRRTTEIKRELPLHTESILSKGRGGEALKNNEEKAHVPGNNML